MLQQNHVLCKSGTIGHGYRLAKAATVTDNARMPQVEREGCEEEHRKQCHKGDKGTIELPLSADYDERPRQKVDRSQGKPALTEYEVVSVREDGSIDILFHPHTGRTHQLRVHSAHTLGLGRPILGDLLYGGCGNVRTEVPSDIRLHLHAYAITFTHPSSGESLTLTTDKKS